ncbi:MAG: hypothetical protein WCE75_13240 [Terracidiphilus sp.]
MMTILLVENDPLHAILRKAILERQFGQVERVTDATEALCLVEQPQFACDLGLVVCGPQRPGFGGPAFVTELHARIPRLPVLVLGGAAEQANDYAGPAVRFLPGPVEEDEILDAAGHLLAEAAGVVA